MGSWRDEAVVSGTTLSAGTLAPPTAVGWSPQCVSGPTPMPRANGTSTDAGGTAKSVSLARPTGVQEGDLLVAAISTTKPEATPPVQPSAGWTLVLATSDYQTVGQWVYTHVAGSAAQDPGPYVWGTVGDRAVGGLETYRGVDPAAPVDVSSGSLSLTAPSVTTTRDNVRLVGIFAVSGLTSPGLPSGMTTRWSKNSFGAPGPDASQTAAVAADEKLATAGSSGPRSASGTGTVSVSQLVALQPPTVASGTVTWTPSASSWASSQQFQLTADGTAQPAETLSAVTSSKSVGQVVPGMSYSATITAQYASWTSSPASVSFTGQSC